METCKKSGIRVHVIFWFRAATDKTKHFAQLSAHPGNIHVNKLTDRHIHVLNKPYDSSCMHDKPPYQSLAFERQLTIAAQKHQIMSVMQALPNCLKEFRTTFAHTQNMSSKCDELM